MGSKSGQQRAALGQQKRPAGFQYEKENTVQTQTIIEAKLVLLGDSGVGKSSIAQRYCKNHFSDAYDVTIGGAYMQQNVTVQNGSIVKMHIWDTGGSDRFRSLVSMYYRDAVAALICYDLTNERSFESVSYWTNEMQQKNNMSNFVIALAGNKCDIDQKEWQITAENMQKMKGSLNITDNIIERNTSAKTGEGVNEIFQQIAERIV